MERSTSRLITEQREKIADITAMRDRLKAKERTSFNANIVHVRNDTLNQMFDDARAAHSEIIGREDALVDEYLADRIFTKIQTVFEETSDFLMTLLSELEAPHEADSNAESSSSNHSTRGSSTSSGQAPAPIYAKLPRLELPKFSGDYDDWENFSDLFKALVHDIPNMSDSAKLISLQSCMQERALHILKGISPSKASYADVWQALNARFQNPRFIVYNELQNLMDVPMIAEESAEKLRYFTDEAQRIVRVLANVKMPVDQWDVWLVFLLAAKLDPASRREWETKLSIKDVGTPIDDANPLQRFPTFKEFASFLEQRSRTLCMLAVEKKTGKTKTHSSTKPAMGTKRSHHVAFPPDQREPSECPLCKGTHFLGKCPTFLQKKPFDRRNDVRSFRLCYNCLGQHQFKDCKSKGRCRTCQGKHNTLIHFNSNRKQGNTGDSAKSQANATATKLDTKVKVNVARVDETPEVSVNACNSNSVNSNGIVLLATALIDIVGPRGNVMRARALLDQGSEATFISESLVRLLGLPKRNVQTSLIGVGGRKTGSANAATYFTVQSRAYKKFRLDMDAYVLPRITTQLPARNVVGLDFALFQHISLADPEFHVSNSIDLLIGADFYGQLLRDGVKQIPNLLLTAQNTALGWVISGPIDQQSSRRAECASTLNALHCQTADLNAALERLWILDEVPTSNQGLKPQDETCEKLFRETHTRDPISGRFCVRLPIISELPKVAAESRRTALGSLSHLKRRFARDSRLEKAYLDFMSEYIKLGHMTLVPASELSHAGAWYLTHHPVIRLFPSYKSRTVFNASLRTSGGHCLNDFLMPGPPLQRDLALILLNWRRYQYVFTADIVKMFRQIQVARENQDLTRILWPPEAPRDWRLTTVTYGTKCAPYLAIRTLLQLASDGRSRFPLGSECLEVNTYVDDIFTGADDLSTALNKRNELVELLKTAGIELDKWAANHRDLLPIRPRPTDTNQTKIIDCDGPVKTLGIHWDPAADQFSFNVSELDDSGDNKITKRYVLSGTARLFDPLGWLAPVTITAKTLMQDLWILKCGWDELLPNETRDRWLSYRSTLAALPNVKLDRWMGLSEDTSFELHGFSDASSRAYAAVVYLRITDKTGNSRVCILSAKSKVSPVKTISIPNLELCGAALLVRLVKHLQRLDFIKLAPTYLYTDSQIVLNWLNKHPCHWKTFVANRVSLIQTELPAASWAHVSTKENPADLATRGVIPSDLKDSEIWWRGPSWLVQSSDKRPQQQITIHTLHVNTHAQPPEFELLGRYSELAKLVRITAFCLRFVANCRKTKNGLNPLNSTLTVPELNYARKALIRAAQLHAFIFEISLLKQGRPLPKGNALRKLNPIISKVDGLLCVGGRLTNSLLSYDLKHPPILPRHSALSVLFVRAAHRIALHGGPTLTTNMLIQRVWILGMRPLVKTTIRHCVTCQRHKPQLAQQLMGDLPAARVTPARPFTTTGVDYAGPFQVRMSKGRGQRATKGYIALFICFSTKAVHLEAVSDLTSKQFIAAFRRFACRKGLCRHLYSDNATNFKGADNELKAMFNAASEFYAETAQTFADDGIEWTFIPPNTPHYGGLWEAGVKSTKQLLKKTIGNHTLTFEELSTVLSEIEACLNSRPLRPLRNEPDDLNILTPAHFLIGDTTALIPDEEPPNVPENRLTIYQVMQRMRNQFWRQWSSDYLHHLQERSKWRSPTENFGVGQMVLVKDDRYPPAKWPIGRVIEVHPGADNLVRTVTVRTATSEYRRHINRLAPLHLDQPKEANAQDPGATSASSS